MKKLLLLLSASFGLSSAAQAQWSELGTGSNALNANGEIFRVEAVGSKVYATGFFSNTAGYYPVMQWNGTTWSELSAGLSSFGFISFFGPMVKDASGNIYAQMQSHVGTDTSMNIAKWNGTTWTQLGSGTNGLHKKQFTDGLAADASGNVYAAGEFTNSSGEYYVAKWNGTAWSELGTGTNALHASGYIWAVAAGTGGSVYAVGNFTNSSGKYYVAKWNGTMWSDLGNSATVLDIGGQHDALVTDASGNVYFGYLDNTNAAHIAKWNGSAWTVLGGTTGIPSFTPGAPHALAVNGTKVYAAGSLDDANSVPYVAMWNGTTWSNVGNSATTLHPSMGFRSLALDGSGNLYAAGDFTNTAGKYYVAKYSSPQAVENVLLPALSIFPNPAGQTVMLSFGRAFEGSVMLYDAMGRMLSTERVNNTQHQLDLSNLPTGCYSVRMQDASGASESRMIIHE